MLCSSTFAQTKKEQLIEDILTTSKNYNDILTTSHIHLILQKTLH